MSTSIDTSSIGYNYSIMYSLFYSKNKTMDLEMERKNGSGKFH